MSNDTPKKSRRRRRARGGGGVRKLVARTFRCFSFSLSFIFGFHRCPFRFSFQASPVSLDTEEGEEEVERWMRRRKTSRTGISLASVLAQVAKITSGDFFISKIQTNVHRYDNEQYMTCFSQSVRIEHIFKMPCNGTLCASYLFLHRHGFFADGVLCCFLSSKK